MNGIERSPGRKAWVARHIEPKPRKGRHRLLSFYILRDITIPTCEFSSIVVQKIEPFVDVTLSVRRGRQAKSWSRKPPKERNT